MKIKGQSNGINISAFINTNEFEKAYVTPLKQRVKVLEAQVRKRNDYIKQMHFQFKRRKWMLYIGYISNELIKPLPNGVNTKRLMCLFYMYEREFTSLIKMKKDFKELGIPHSYLYSDFKFLERIGLATKDNRNFYYILDKGREVVEYYEKNMKIRFLHMTKIKQDDSQLKKEKAPKKENGTKFSPEEIERRRATYHKMMRPFWDSGIKLMPKDKGKRIEILLNWMEVKGIKDEWYTKLVFNWGSK